VINGWASTYGDRGLVVLGINLWQSQSIVQQYQNQNPNILMLKDSGSVWNTWYIGGYIPLNYIVGHDLDQTVEYRAEGFNSSAILNKIKSLLSDVSVVLTLDSPTFQQGSSIGFSVELENHATTSQSFFAIIDVETTTGSYYQLYPTFPLTLNVGVNPTYPLTYPLPTGVPALGNYTMRVRLGIGPPAELWMTDSEPSEIVP